VQRRRPRLRFGLGATLILGLLAGIAAVLGWAVIARRVAPLSNTPRGRFDAIIVLGYPADSDGNPTPPELARVAEAVHEYERGVAPRLLLTGGPAHNIFVESEVMAKVAEAEGIPASAVFVEPRSKDTIENACYATRMMKEHGWRSAEVISSTSHLPRAALIFSRLTISYRMHAAPGMGPEPIGLWTPVEILKTARYLTYARWSERCQP
jgi:uncharacterized SAM-binding protein YcdF (DUF218 family)